MANLALLARRDPGSGSLVFIPSREEDKAQLERMKIQPGDELRAKFKRARNPAHHRLVFALVNFVYANQERFDSIEGFRCWLTLKTSFVHTYQDGKTGGITRIPRSWSFEEMDEDDFTRLHQELIPVVLREFMPGLSGEELQSAVDQHAFMEGVSGFI